jgi:hypothetical protein
MWNLISCYFSGRHDYGMWCERGTIYLRCLHCGRRSCGWNINQRGVEAEAETARHLTATVAPAGATFKRAAAG